MPIRLYFDEEDGGTKPVFVCDWCNEPIRELAAGVYLMPHKRGPDDWVVLHDDPKDPNCVPLFAHRDKRSEDGARVGGCHTALDQHLYQTRNRTVCGWLALSEFPGALARSATDSNIAFAHALKLDQRDGWLLHWIAAGMPDGRLLGQPKGWNFTLEDVSALAERLKAALPQRPSYDTALEDDVRLTRAFDQTNDSE